MISLIKGSITQVNVHEKLGSIEVLTAGGVGYEILVGSRLLSSVVIGDELTIYVKMLVREDDQYLCGFQSRLEKDLFELLTSVSGIGPKTAMAIISMYTGDELREIIGNSDVKKLSKVSGLGVKGAQKIMLELTGKLDEVLAAASGGKGGKVDLGNPVIEQLNDALFQLGFRGAELQKMLKNGDEIRKAQSDIVIEVLIEKVLRG